jgi:PAS domain S-box-containing protein
MARFAGVTLSKYELGIGLLVLSIFLVDLWTPLGIAVGLLYIIPVWMTAWSNVAAAPILLSILCAMLTVIGATMGPPGLAPVWYAVVNRSMSIVAIMIGGYLAHREVAGRHALAEEMGRREATEVALRESELRQRLQEAVKESEQRLNLALESAEMGAWEWDIRRDSVIRSLRHDQIFGYDKLQPQWGVAVFMTHIPPEDQEQVKQQMDQAIAAGQLHLECRILWPDQSLHWIKVKGRVYRDEQGAPVKMLGTVMDITQRKEAESELRRVQLFLASLVDNIPDMVFVKDPKDLRFLLVNKAAEDLLGYAPADMIGKRVHDFFPKEEAEFITSKDLEVLKTGQFVETPEQSMQTRHKGPRIFNTKKIPILDKEGRPLYLVGILQDITQRRQLERERETLIDQLQNNLARIKTLEGILPICAHCKRIRDEEGQWHAVELYVRGRSNADFSHGICPICLQKHYPGVDLGLPS